MKLLSILKLVINKNINRCYSGYNEVGKRFIYCNGEIISYRKIMKLKRMYQYITFVAGMILLVCYGFIVKLLLG